MNWKNFKARAYTPYSENGKACIIESNAGQLFPGVRVENVSFPLSIGALQSAILQCLEAGETPKTLYCEDTDFELFGFWVEKYGLDVVFSAEPPELPALRLLPIDIKPQEALKLKLPDAVVHNSEFPVSALLEVENGFIPAVNVEIPEWSLGLCAERMAIAKAIAHGYSGFKQLFITTKYGEISSPCGACRQVLSELLPFHPITLYHKDGTCSRHLSVDLLPFQFKSSHLKNP